MDQPVVLVTGAAGQLGRTLQDLAPVYPGLRFVFVSKSTLDISSAEAVNQYFAQQRPAYCINCAAYTAVDKAESEREAAMQINGLAAGTLAAACTAFNCRFVHISTDYVFAGNSARPYTEEDTVDPVNFYGESKLQGEQLAAENCPAAIIVRTSWVYSVHGGNFVKTMLRLMKERESVSVVDDQLGSPTYAPDLAAALLTLVVAAARNPGEWKPGIYHFSNEGITSWYGFASAIAQKTHANCRVLPVPTAAYPTPAKRPSYSGLDKTKIKSVFNVEVPFWENSLDKALVLMQQS